MKTRLKTTFGAALAATTLALAPAGAKGTASPLPEANPDTYGGCSIGGGFYGYHGGRYRGAYYGSRYHGSGHYRSGYRGGYHHGGYSTRCRIVDRCYFYRGCYRYCRITYLHERVDCHGRVVSCWRTYKTVRG